MKRSGASPKSVADHDDHAGFGFDHAHRHLGHVWDERGFEVGRGDDAGYALLAVGFRNEIVGPGAVCGGRRFIPIREEHAHQQRVGTKKRPQYESFSH